MTKEEYARVAHRGIAAGAINGVTTPLRLFGEHAELSGIKVNEELLQILDLLDSMASKLAVASQNDWDECS